MTSIPKKSSMENDSVDRFLVVWNRIEANLKQTYGSDDHDPVLPLIDRHASRFQQHEDRWLLHEARNLRNILIHNKLSRGPYFAVPSEAIINRLEQIAQYLEHPEVAAQRFQRVVTKVESSTSLADVCRLIAQTNFSQFPVYTGANFRGLLTENGVTRWLAYHVSQRLSLIELDDIAIDQVLSMEEARENHTFVGRTALVADIRELFVTKGFLEAVFISESGKPSEQLLGIATRWDLPEMQDSSKI